MNAPIQNEAQIEETNERTSMSIKDPDAMISMSVLLVACLALAVLAHVIL